MWTAPSSQDALQRFNQIACVHMSGLLMRSHMNAGQDGFRDKGSKQQCDLREGAIGSIGVSGVVDRSITPSAHHLASSDIGSARLQSSCSPCLADLWTAPRWRARISLCGSLLSPSFSTRRVSCCPRMVEGCIGRVVRPESRYVTVRSGSRPIRHRAEGGRNRGYRKRATRAARGASTTSGQAGLADHYTVPARAAGANFAI